MEQPFWSEGLSFECTQCSACCRHEPGLVLLSASDLRTLIRFKALDFQSFISNYCRLVAYGSGKAISLTETADYDCIFWRAGVGCTVYEARPVQCRTYPFWFGILDSPEDWERERRFCPGIGDGPVRSRREIEEALWAYRKNTPIALPADAAEGTLDEDTLLGR